MCEVGVDLEGPQQMVVVFIIYFKIIEKHSTCVTCKNGYCDFLTGPVMKWGLPNTVKFVFQYLMPLMLSQVLKTSFEDFHRNSLL